MDLDISVVNVLRRARLPDDLLAREQAVLSQEAYFSLWNAVTAEANDPLLPIRIAQALRAEVFDPPVFAAICSPNLVVALRRVSAYKRLIAPQALIVDDTSDGLGLVVRWLDKRQPPPLFYALTEITFFTQLARMATRTDVRPVAVTVLELPETPEVYREHLGVALTVGEDVSIRFSREDAERPFLTANSAMWSFFEPELSRRLFELDASASTSERVRSALLELLPNGGVSVGDVASKLGVSKRTLQRRLESESMRYQTILDETREALALHYLRSSQMTGAEIAFLLGFDDPNSFFRAFRMWTGETPEQTRESLRGATQAQ